MWFLWFLAGTGQSRECEPVEVLPEFRRQEVKGQGSWSGWRLCSVEDQGIQASEPQRRSAWPHKFDITSQSSFCIYSLWRLLYKQALKMFGKSDLTLFDIWNLTSLEWNCCLTCRFLLSQHLSSHVDLLISSFARGKIKNSARHLHFL